MVYTLLVVTGLIVIDTLLGVIKQLPVVALISVSWVLIISKPMCYSLCRELLAILGAGALYVQPELLGAIFGKIGST